MSHTTVRCGTWLGASGRTCLSPLDEGRKPRAFWRGRQKGSDVGCDNAVHATQACDAGSAEQKNFRKVGPTCKRPTRSALAVCETADRNMRKRQKMPLLAHLSAPT